MALSDGGKLYRTELALVLCAEDMWESSISWLSTSLDLLHAHHPHPTARKAVSSCKVEIMLTHHVNIAKHWMYFCSFEEPVMYRPSICRYTDQRPMPHTFQSIVSIPFLNVQIFVKTRLIQYLKGPESWSLHSWNMSSHPEDTRHFPKLLMLHVY